MRAPLSYNPPDCPYPLATRARSGPGLTFLGTAILGPNVRPQPEPPTGTAPMNESRGPLGAPWSA